MNITPSTTAGRKLRLSKRGLPGPDGQSGNLYAVVQIDVPKAPTAEERELYAALKKGSSFDARASLAAQVERQETE